MQQVKRNFPAPIPTHDLGGGSFPLIFARTFLVMPLTCYLQFSMNAFFKSKDIFFLVFVVLLKKKKIHTHFFWGVVGWCDGAW